MANGAVDDATASGGVDATVTVTIDGEDVEATPNRPVIDVAREAGSYVPGWCHHPSSRPASELEASEVVYRPGDDHTITPPRSPDDDTARHGEAIWGDAGADYDGCDMCIVEVDGELVRGCETRVSAGMAVETATDAARERQHDAMAELFEHHPHVCISCPHKEGCDRISCTMNVPEDQRCCDLLGNCELEKSAEATELDWNQVPKYEPLERPAERNAVFDVNWELCIGCTRCVGVCEDHVGAGVWRFTPTEDGPTDVTVGLRAGTLAKSGCKYCTACVDACPTGTLMDYDGGKSDRLPLEFRESLEEVGLPEDRFALTGESVAGVPDQAGVYRLYDDEGTVVEINGVPDLAAELETELETADAEEFDFELAESYTQRETELVEQFVNKHGHMPGAGGAMDDLF